jgi:hypothetical protein
MQSLPVLILCSFLPFKFSIFSIVVVKYMSTGWANPSYLGSETGGMASLRTAWAKLVRPCIKNKIKTKGVWRLAQVVEHLVSKHTALFCVGYF